MEKVKLTKVARFTTKQDGTPLKTKDGRPYTSVRIQVEGRDFWISGFGNPENEKWDVGSEVEIDIVQKGDYWNFTMPKPIDKMDDKLETILNRLTGISLRVESIYAAVVKKEKPSLNGPTAFDDSPFSDGPLPSDDDAF